MLMSSASESACSRDGEGDTELDLDMNILPQWGCPRSGPPTPRAGKDAGFRAKAGARQAAAGRRCGQTAPGAVGARPRQRRRGAAGSGAAALTRAGQERGADGAWGKGRGVRSLRLRLGIGAGLEGTRRGGRLSLQPAVLPPTFPRQPQFWWPRLAGRGR